MLQRLWGNLCSQSILKVKEVCQSLFEICRSRTKWWVSDDGQWRFYGWGRTGIVTVCMCLGWILPALELKTIPSLSVIHYRRSTQSLIIANVCLLAEEKRQYLDLFQSFLLVRDKKCSNSGFKFALNGIWLLVSLQTAQACSLHNSTEHFIRTQYEKRHEHELNLHLPEKLQITQPNKSLIM